MLDPDAMPIWLADFFSNNINNKNIIAGINEDDCAIIEFGNGYLVATTDYLNSNPIACQLGIGTLYDLGKLTVSASVSDLCGTGAQPRGLLIGAMMQKGCTLREFQEFMEGVRDLSQDLKIPVIGGDTKLGPTSSFFGVGLGYADSLDCLFIKNKASAGDLIWVSGEIGACNAATLGVGKKVLNKKQEEWAKRSILSPKIPLDKSQNLSKSHLGKAGIDISDGLSNDLFRMCSASGVGAIIELNNIPIDPMLHDVSTLIGFPAWSFAFGTGGDAQFLVTSEEKNAKMLESLGFYKIGVLTNDPNLVIKDMNGHHVPMPIGGHRDARHKTFMEEINILIKQVIKAIEGDL